MAGDACLGELAKTASLPRWSPQFSGGSPRVSR